MKKRFTRAAAALAAALAVNYPDHAVPAPEVTYDKVQEIFGLNLEQDDTPKKLLLLAVGMDHTSPDSPFSDQRIGIPFIVDAGPYYWVSRLKSGERKVEVLVNNALLLMFTKEEIPRQQEVAVKLLEVAGDHGYWPADYFIADYNLSTKLSRDFQNPNFVRAPLLASEEMRSIAQDTMDRLNRCAEIGFAPCQYRIGFWLLGSEKTVPDGIKVLRSAMTTTLADKRYQGFLESAAAMAARQIATLGVQAGLSASEVAKYAKFIQVMQEQINDGVSEYAQ